MIGIMQKMRLSVIMSIYNETESQIKESVCSIINQTFSDFEFIIINDNPQRKEIVNLISHFQDKRIRYYVNENNIGLAMSMNRAASLATSGILARMDADDISFGDRLEKEYDILETGNYDLVFSRYQVIDENSTLVKDECPYYYYEPKDIDKKLVQRSLIHHPTVMMTKDVFMKSGGYRDFPCSQDIDLWLRMIYKGVRMFMCKDVLLKYRVASNSISSNHWYQQQLTIHYINMLFVERLRGNNDSYSKESYNEFLLKHKVSDVKKKEKLRKGQRVLSKAGILWSQGKRCQSTIMRLYVFFTQSFYRNEYILTRKKVRLYNEYIKHKIDNI